jgi:uncharacterized membrane protein (DUF485 family)
MKTQETPMTSGDWQRIASTPEFKDLIQRKRSFILPATVFFTIYYFALPVMVGYFPEIMSRKVAGAVNIAYVFALSQFVMAWILAFMYVRAAGTFDRMADDAKRAGGRS